jgi:hypothetical protein
MLIIEDKKNVDVVKEHVGDDFKLPAMVIGAAEGVSPTVLECFALSAISLMLDTGKIMLRREGE